MMEEKDPVNNNRDNENSGFDRDDSNRKDEKNYTAFAKDKRARSRVAEKVTSSGRREPRTDDSAEEKPQRRSFNPNFSEENQRKESYQKPLWRPDDQGKPQRDYPEGDYQRDRSNNDRPRRSSYGNNYERRDGDSSQRPSWKSENNDRPSRNYEHRDRDNTDRPRRSSYDNNYERRDGDSSQRPWRSDNNDRPPRSYEQRDRDNTDRPSRNYDQRDRDYGDRPHRSYGNNNSQRDGSYGQRSGGYNNNRYNSGERNQGNNRGGGYNRYDKNRQGGQGGRSYGSRPQQRNTEYPKFPAPRFDEGTRLNRYIATSGLCSRREADKYISAGLVTVNGIVVTELGTKINPSDEVMIKDRAIQSEKMVYLVMNKPKGYVTTLDDPHADKTVMDIIKDACKERIYPVGRLDKNSLGVLLFTNDGDLTTKLTHPSYNKKKVYQVSLDKSLTRADMDQIVGGIDLEDGEIHADAVSYLDEGKREIGIEIHSGRNRIVRRIFEHLGYKVTKLDRVYFAGLTKKNLKRGGWRFLSPREVQMLKSGQYE